MDLSDIRVELDKVDSEIIELYLKRMELCGHVAQYKIENNMPVLDAVRERQKIDKVRSQVSDEFDKDSVEELFELLMKRSRMLQEEIIKKNKED